MSIYKPSTEMMDLIFEDSKPKQVRKYRIICLKRSRLASKDENDFISDWYKDSCLFYWRDNYSGYTHLVEEAGLYTLKEIEGAAGSHGDWLIEPVWVDE